MVQLTPELVNAVIALVLFLICNPFVEIGFNDDWQYARMAKTLATTGLITYDGWTRTMALPQVVWGALIVHIFGFSFSALRASMLVFTVLTSSLMYRISRWAQLTVTSSVFAAAVLTLSPLYLPVATAFMTDSPAVCFFLITAFCALRAATTKTRGALGWLCATAIAGTLGGATRQIIWGAPLMMLPALIFLRKRDRRFTVTALCMLAATCVAILFSLKWFYRQPFIYAEQLRFPTSIPQVHLLEGNFARMLATIVLLCLPPMARFILSANQLRECWVVVLGTLSVVLISATKWPWIFMAPWLGNILTRFGIMSVEETIVGFRPVVLPPVVSWLLGVSAVTAFILTVITLLRGRKPLLSAPPVNLKADSGQHRLKIYLWIMGPFMTAYLAVVLLTSVTHLGDRYLLEVIAVVVIPLLILAERTGNRTNAVTPWLLLACFASYGVVATHDIFRVSEARFRTTDSLIRSGIYRTCIVGGYEFDAWTELEASRSIVSPDKLQARGAPVEYFFLRSTPHVIPKYYIVLSKQQALTDTGFPETQYSTWLPPARRAIFVQQNPDINCNHSVLR